MSCPELQSTAAIHHSYLFVPRVCSTFRKLLHVLCQYILHINRTEYYLQWRGQWSTHRKRVNWLLAIKFAISIFHFALPGKLMLTLRQNRLQLTKRIWIKLKDKFCFVNCLDCTNIFLTITATFSSTESHNQTNECFRDSAHSYNGIKND